MLSASASLQRLRDAVQEFIGHRFLELTTTDAEAHSRLRFTPQLGVAEARDLIAAALTSCIAWGVDREQHKPVLSEGGRLIDALRALHTTWRDPANLHSWNGAFRSWGDLQHEYQQWYDQASLLVAEATGLEMRVQPDDAHTVDVGPKKKSKGRNINGAMLNMLLTNSDARGWSAREWAERLDCSHGTVTGTKAWKGLENTRSLAAVAAQEKMDRTRTHPAGRKKPRPKSSYS